MKDLHRRLINAMKRERGLRLTPAEAIRVANLLGVNPEPEATPANPKAMSKAVSNREPISAHVRWMIRRDMDEVLSIENSCYEFPWTREEFIRCLRQRNCIGMVAEFDEKVVGFMVYELHKGMLHVLNFAVSPEHQLRSVGKTMLDKLKGKLSQDRRSRIVIEIRETNTAGIRFLASTGFRAVATIRGFYDEFTDEDAIEFQYGFNSSIELTPVNSKASQPQSWKPDDDDDELEAAL